VPLAQPQPTRAQPAWAQCVGGVRWVLPDAAFFLANETNTNERVITNMVRMKVKSSVFKTQNQLGW